jgi:predicted ATPase
MRLVSVIERTETEAAAGGSTVKRPFHSEIRQSTIAELHDKVRSRNYGKYLTRVALSRVRGFRDQEVRFDFPVTALIGPNGGGKTTVLGAAGCAYKEIQPRQFFAKSGKFDDSMQDWTIEYELVDKSQRPREVIRRTASFKRQRWNRDAPSRETLTFGVARTVPASERVELRKCASNQFTVPADRIVALASEVADAAQKILGKDISKFETIQVDTKGRVSLLTGRTNAGEGYSEFHFGAGESSIIRMLIEIEAADENSLILIEEIENGLHPVATVRMVEYLIDVAHRKKAQVIFTTHSNDALAPLPTDAVWVCLNGEVVQGKLDVRALRAITGQIDARLAIFAEDDFARNWIEVALRRYGKRVALDAIEIHAMQGDGTAVKINEHHNADPTVAFPSVCFLDGDSRQETGDRVFRLPGEVPETYIFYKVVECIETAVARLAAGLHVPLSRQAEVIEVARDVGLTCRDPHLLFAQIGERLGLLSEIIVRGAFLGVWADDYPEEVEALFAPLDDLLPLDR